MKSKTPAITWVILGVGVVAVIAYIGFKIKGSTPTVINTGQPAGAGSAIGTASQTNPLLAGSVVSLTL